MKTIGNLRIGFDSGNTGFWTTHRSTTDATSAEFVVVGFRLRKSRWTISNQEMQRTCLQLVIFNQPIGIAILEKAVKDGSQESAKKPTSS